MKALLQKIQDNLIFWLALKMLVSRRSLFGGSAIFAFVGLALGVSALVVSMAVFSGYEATLKSAVADISGHMQVVKRSRFSDDWIELTQRLQTLEPDIEATARFVFVEAVTAGQGQISGVLIQGVDQDHFAKVLSYESRVVEGSAQLGAGTEGLPLALLGKRLAEKFNLKVGSKFKVVVPVASSLDENHFERRLGEFEVGAILDLGKFDWNERVVITDLRSTQKMAEIGDRYSGLFIRYKDIDGAREAAVRLSQKLGAPYWIRDWRESNENLFDAVVYERIVIFFVVLIIVIVAAFNVSSNLFVNVMQRFGDIAILKTLGLNSRQVMLLFSAQGVLMGAIGFVSGTFLGWFLCQAFMFLQKNFELISGSVYKIDGIQVEIRVLDLVVIFVATVIICFVATLAPARKGAKLSPVEGLRYG